VTDAKDQGPIDWGRVRERIPATAEPLLREIQEAYERSPEDPARAVEHALRAHVGRLRSQFQAACEGEKS
jgi:hypothetical protein